MIGDDDWDTFFDPDDFGHEATWQTDSETVEEIGGVFQAENTDVLAGKSAGVSATASTFTMAEDQIPDTWAQEDDFEITGKGNFLVVDVQPDGSGMARIILERA